MAKRCLYAFVGEGELDRRGVGRGAVLLADGVPDLLAVDRGAARGLDAHANGISDDLHHVHDDIVADDDLLADRADSVASSAIASSMLREYGTQIDAAIAARQPIAEWPLPLNPDAYHGTPQAANGAA